MTRAGRPTCCDAARNLLLLDAKSLGREDGVRFGLAFLRAPPSMNAHQLRVSGARTRRSRPDARPSADRRPSPCRSARYAVEQAFFLEVPRASSASRLAPEQAAQLAGGAKQVDADGRFLQAGHGADLARRAVAVMAEHEDRPLPAVEPIDRRRDACAALAREQAVLRVVAGPASRRAGLVRARDLGARPSTVAARSRLPSIQAAVDENPCEPDLERPRFAIRA